MRPSENSPSPGQAEGALTRALFDPRYTLLILFLFILTFPLGRLRFQHPAFQLIGPRVLRVYEEQPQVKQSARFMALAHLAIDVLNVKGRRLTPT